MKAKAPLVEMTKLLRIEAAAKARAEREKVRRENRKREPLLWEEYLR